MATKKAPHSSIVRFSEMGVLDHIPPNAVITAEVTVLANRSDPSAGDVSETGRPPG